MSNKSHFMQLIAIIFGCLTSCQVESRAGKVNLDEKKRSRHGLVKISPAHGIIGSWWPSLYIGRLLTPVSRSLEAGPSPPPWRSILSINLAAETLGPYLPPTSSLFQATVWSHKRAAMPSNAPAPLREAVATPRNYWFLSFVMTISWPKTFKWHFLGQKRLAALKQNSCKVTADHWWDVLTWPAALLICWVAWMPSHSLVTGSIPAPQSRPGYHCILLVHSAYQRDDMLPIPLCPLLSLPSQLLFAPPFVSLCLSRLARLENMERFGPFDRGPFITNFALFLPLWTFLACFWPIFDLFFCCRMKKTNENLAVFDKSLCGLRKAAKSWKTKTRFLQLL